MSEDKRRFSVQYLLRMPKGMRERLSQAAEANDRSMNVEIVSRLEQSLRLDGSPGNEAVSGDLGGKIETLMEELNKVAGSVRVLQSRMTALENKLKE